jgi:hypothetical protein
VTTQDYQKALGRKITAERRRRGDGPGRPEQLIDQPEIKIGLGLVGPSKQHP